MKNHSILNKKAKKLWCIQSSLVHSDPTRHNPKKIGYYMKNLQDIETVGIDFFDGLKTDDIENFWNLNSNVNLSDLIEY